MRIVGELPHPRYKITVFEMSQKLSVKIEDQALEQSFRFRDGSGIGNIDEVRELLDESFMLKVAETFKLMATNYYQALESREKDQDLNFEII